MSMTKIGRVSSIDLDTNTARVVFEEEDNVVSNNLKVVSHGNSYYTPKINELVVCLFLQSSCEDGVIIGGYKAGRSDAINGQDSVVIGNGDRVYIGSKELDDSNSVVRKSDLKEIVDEIKRVFNGHTHTYLNAAGSPTPSSQPMQGVSIVQFIKVETGSDKVRSE